jgi:hypothetical protein
VKITDEQMQELRTKYPRGVVKFTLRGETENDNAAPVERDFVFQRASADHVRRHKADMMQLIVDASVAATSSERMAQELCVWPDGITFQRFRDEDPRLASEIGDKLLAAVACGLKLSEGKVGN